VSRSQDTVRSRGGAIVALLPLGVAGLALAGCETTQDVSARIGERLAREQQASTGLERQGRAPRGVRAGRPTLLPSGDASAIVVEVVNRSPRAWRDLPVAVRVRGGGVDYTNRTVGLETAQLRIPTLEPGARLWWVNDHLPAIRGRARTVRAAVGRGRPIAGAVPRVRVTGLRAGREDGRPVVRGVVRNLGRRVVRDLTVFTVALRDGRPVAAGTAKVLELPPGARRDVTTFVVGDPTRGRLVAAAPPAPSAR
jgi:hypothetical protein